MRTYLQQLTDISSPKSKAGRKICVAFANPTMMCIHESQCRNLHIHQYDIDKGMEYLRNDFKGVDRDSDTWPHPIDQWTVLYRKQRAIEALDFERGIVWQDGDEDPRIILRRVHFTTIPMEDIKGQIEVRRTTLRSSTIAAIVVAIAAEFDFVTVQTLRYRLWNRPRGNYPS